MEKSKYCLDISLPLSIQARKHKMDWVPVVFITFKVLVFGTGMFFAIKWHYDQGKKEKDKDREK